MNLRTLTAKISSHCRSHGILNTVQFLASRVVRHQQHVVFEAVLDTAPADVMWPEEERLKVIDRSNVDAAIGTELRAFLGGDGAQDNLEGVRSGNELFVVANGAAYHHCGYILFQARQMPIIGESKETPLIACCFTAAAARGRGLYRQGPDCRIAPPLESRAPARRD